MSVSAKEVGQLAYLLRFGLYAHAAALEIARDPRISSNEMASMGQSPTGTILCKDGTERSFDLAYVLDQMRAHPVLRTELDRAWCVSSLILLGDRLAAEDYFDRAPVLEMVRHLRNGIAHGNRFTLRNTKEMDSWPAHTREASCQTGEPFEITAELDGHAVLFDFMAPGDVLDLLISVGTYLMSFEQG